MALKQKKQIKRKVICGKGYCTCQNKKYVHGKGIMDIFNSVKNLAEPAINFVKDNAATLKSTAETIGNVVKIGDSTKTIVQEIMKRKNLKCKRILYRILLIKSISLKWVLDLLMFSFLVNYS